jgi:alpha-galactosidase
MKWLLLCCLVLVPSRELTGQKPDQAHGQITSVDAARLALTPPMGWNSWDGYGTTINEAQVKANAEWMAEHLKAFGWQYVVVDMEWFVLNPTPEGNSRTFQYSLDRYGRYTPALNRFPSAANGVGFKPLADYVHSLGLRFGIHILRGIPKQAAVNKMPIADSSYSAADGADSSDTCPWNFDNFGTKPGQPAAEAYYDSMAKMYAAWGVDLIKVDCISSHPYDGDDIRMIRQALDKTGRPMVLSLSPGPAPVEKLEQMREYAQMWRVSNDIWDIWHNDGGYPKGLGDQFSYIAKWAGRAQPGHWPDADMLPLGRLGPAPGWGEPRDTRLNHDEQRTLLTLWVMFPSPLMVGGELPAANAWTLSLLTNPEVIAVDQHSTGNHAVINTDRAVVWLAQSGSGDGQYLAIFNLSESNAVLRYEWKDLGLAGKVYQLRDLWEHRDLGSANAMSVTLPPHGSALYRVSPPGDARR